MGRLGLAILLLSLPAASPAAVVFNTFTAGDGYDATTGLTLGGGSFNATPGLTQAARFSPSLSLPLFSVDFAAGLIVGTNTVLISLRADSAGQPGSTLEIWTVTGQMGDFGLDNPIISVNSVARPPLSAGTNYWLTLSVPNLLDDWSAWNQATSATGTVAFQEGTGNWSVLSSTALPAFRINAEEEIPEPSTWLLVLMGLVPIRCALRRAR